MATAAMAEIDAGTEQMLRSCLRGFVAAAYMHTGDRRAVDLLARARQEAEGRNERWWLAETIRLQAEADARLDGGGRALELLAEAEALAVDQGAVLIAARIADTRRALGLQLDSSEAVR
jgi:hypothetical protein